MLPTQTMAELGLNFVHRRLIGAAKGFASGGFAGAGIGFVTAGENTAGKGLGLGGGVTQSLPGTITPGCPEGFELDAQGRCAKSGLRGVLERFVPGGETGFTGVVPSFADPTQAGQLAAAGAFGDAFGEAVLGRFGVALQPAIVSAVRLRCPQGAVLGKDNLCYDKLRKGDRKWNPGARPLLTGGDMNTLRRARSLQARLKRLGLTGEGARRKKRAPKLLC